MLYTPPVGNLVNFDLVLYTPPVGNLVNFDFVPEILAPFFLGFGLSGNIGKVGDPDPLGINGIYQMRMTLQGKKPVKMKFYTPTNPRTVPQQANRSKFANAMSAWVSLTTSEKMAYTMRAKKRNMFGHGLFIREYYQANP